MRRMRFWGLVVLVLSGICLASAPQVTQVTASQRTDGSGIVDISFRLDDEDNDSYTITVQASDDGGVMWSVPITSFLPGSAVGNNVKPGMKSIFWNSKADLPGTFGNDYLIKITARIYRVGQIINADNHPLCPPNHPGAVYDLSTNKLWLDYISTVGRSYNDIKSKLGPGMEFDGWRIANEFEVRQFFANVGLSRYGSFGFRASYEEWKNVNGFLEIFGQNYGGFFDTSTQLFFDTTFSSFPYRMMLLRAYEDYYGYCYGFNINEFNTGFATPSTGNNKAGIALVRDDLGHPLP